MAIATAAGIIMPGVLFPDEVRVPEPSFRKPQMEWIIGGWANSQELATAFTNLEFIALSADATRVGDHLFSNLIQSIQSDEARHSQIGIEVVKLLVKSGKSEEAQRLVDIGFWLLWRQFAVITGIAMDYYTPLEKREHSFKEFMEEWVITQFERQLIDVGLTRPWYWETFLRDIETFHHGQHLSLWLTRPTLWWNPAAGVTPVEREWLEAKYAGWNSTFGKLWDFVVENLREGKENETYLTAMPMACHVSHLRITGVPEETETLKACSLEYDGKRYYFGSAVDPWIFQQEPDRYRGFYTLTERFFSGLVQPQTQDGLRAYIGTADAGGIDAHEYAWLKAYAKGSQQHSGGTVPRVPSVEGQK